MVVSSEFGRERFWGDLTFACSEIRTGANANAKRQNGAKELTNCGRLVTRNGEVGRVKKCVL
jgi:hypothetical protein